MWWCPTHRKRRRSSLESLKCLIYIPGPLLYSHAVSISTSPSNSSWKMSITFPNCCRDLFRRASFNNHRQRWSRRMQINFAVVLERPFPCPSATRMSEGMLKFSAFSLQNLITFHIHLQSAHLPAIFHAEFQSEACHKSETFRFPWTVPLLKRQD